MKMMMMMMMVMVMTLSSWLMQTQTHTIQTHTQSLPEGRHTATRTASQQPAVLQPALPH
jgi:hypothetical protein